jgi:hypothetical protein
MATIYEPTTPLTCIQSLQEKIDNNTLPSVVRIFPSTPTEIYISPTSNQLLNITISRQEAVVFTLVLQSDEQTRNVGVTVTFYQIDNGVITNLGYALITEMTTSFEKDMLAGKYYICISSSTYTYTGTITGEFTGFDPLPTFRVNQYTGQRLSALLTSDAFLRAVGYQGQTCQISLTTKSPHLLQINAYSGQFHGSFDLISMVKPPPKPCGDVFYELVDGELPPRNNFDTLRSITGHSTKSRL